MSTASYVGFIYKNETDKIVFRITSHKKPKPPEDVVILKEVVFYVDFDTATEQMQNVIAEMLDQSNTKHFYAVAVRETSTQLNLFFYKTKKEFQNKEVLGYKIYQKVCLPNPSFDFKDYDFFDANVQAYLEAKTWFANSKAKLLHAKTMKEKKAEPCFVETISTIPYISQIIPKQMEFEPGDLIRHYDNFLHEHFGIVLEAHKDYCKLILFSTHPEWSEQFRPLNEKERCVIESCLFGRIKIQKKKQTYICKASKDVPNIDLTLISKGLSTEIFEKIAIEFLNKNNNHFQQELIHVSVNQ